MVNGVARTRVRVKDGFQNFEARLGIGTDNLSTNSQYGFTPITRNRALLDNMYRGSWVVRQVVGVMADDMTKSGVTLKGSADPANFEKTVSAMGKKGFWNKVTETIRWGRLYGGCVAVMMIDGQDTASELRVNTLTRGQFKGLVVMDRWMLTPSDEVVRDFGPDFGKPVYYDLVSSGKDTGPIRRIHHTRVVRVEGEPLPHFQRQYENGWGMSVVEPFYDRLVAFDSTTLGIAQLVYKAHLRIYKMKDLRKSIVAGGDAFNGALSQIHNIRRMQQTEGLTLIDSEDEMSALTYSFAGLPDVMIQMSQQIAGAVKTPVVKLFGMSPAGFSTGDSDLKSYEDNVGLEQERQLREPLERLLRVVYVSECGVLAPDDMAMDFNPLRQMDLGERAKVASSMVQAVMEAQQALTRPQVLQELRNIAEATGVFSSITQDDVDDAVAATASPDDGGAGASDVPVGEVPSDDVDPQTLETDSGALARPTLPVLRLAGGSSS